MRREGNDFRRSAVGIRRTALVAVTIVLLVLGRTKSACSQPLSPEGAHPAISDRETDPAAVASEKDVTDQRAAAATDTSADKTTTTDATRRHEDASQRPGRCRMSLRAPDGEPIVGKTVLVYPRRLDHVREEDREYDGTATTDETGHLEYSIPAGVWRVRVRVAGVGFGRSGTVVIQPGQTTEFELPWLAPTITVTGRLDQDLQRHGATLKARYDDHPWRYELPVVMGQNGNFEVCDAIPGTYWFDILVSDEFIRANGGTTVDVPISRDIGVIHRKQPYLTGWSPGGDSAEAIDGRQAGDDTSVEGIVREADGKPAAGVQVYAVSEVYLGLRCGLAVDSAVTDDNGRFKVPAVSGGTPLGDRKIIAYRQGLPWAWTTAQQVQPRDSILIPDGRHYAHQPRYAAVELTLPAHGGRLRVRVVQDGKPVTRGTVMLEPGGEPRLDYWLHLTREKMAELRRHVAPTASTEADGVATFESLLPGFYKATAVVGSERDLPGPDWYPEDSNQVFARMSGICVRAGETQTAVIKVCPFMAAKDVTFEVQPSGSRPLHGALQFNSGRWEGIDLQVNDVGLGKRRLDKFGLCPVEIRDTPYKTGVRPVRFPPIDTATVYVASSLLLSGRHPVPVTLVAHEPGRVVIELQHEDGTPARGVVGLYSGTQLYSAGSTDAEGRAKFVGVPAGHYWVRGHCNDTPDPEPGERAPVLDEDFYRNRRLVKAVVVPVHADSEMHVVLRERPVGYIRAKIVASDNRDLSEAMLLVPQPGIRVPRGFYRRRELKPGSLDYLCGPLFPGKYTLVVSDKLSQPELATQDKFEVEVQAGKLSQQVLDLAAKKNVPDEAPVPAQFPTGHVYLVDHTTPACGANIAFVPRDPSRGILFGTSDGAGRMIRVGGMPATPGEASSADSAGTDTRAEQDSLLIGTPGGWGVTLFRVGDAPPDRFVLERSHTVEGQVTVAGSVVTDLPASCRVHVERADLNQLNSLTECELDTNADGSFALAELTAGDYRIQAALDGVWLSRTIAFEVTDKGYPPLTLEIPAPGRPVLVHCRGPNETRLKEFELEVVRPDGPLRGALWPATYHTDGAGDLYLEGLEVGRHVLRAVKSGQSRTIDVPELQQANTDKAIVTLTWDPAP